MTQVRAHMTLTGSTGAIFSDCERYRYLLWREWDKALPTLCFLMLNPSTADEQTNDPTITRCESRAVAMAFGRIEVVNLFAYRATDPGELKSADVNGKKSYADKAIIDAVERATMVICAWGAHDLAQERAAEVYELIKRAGHSAKLKHLGLNKNGSPKHPLYVAASQKIERYAP